MKLIRSWRRIVRQFLLIGILFLVIALVVQGQEENEEGGGENEQGGEEHEEEEEVEPVVTVLFPWFIQCLGLLVFLIQTRNIASFPYTAVMFIIGTAMGAGYAKLQGTNELAESISKWLQIDSETLLNVFLPGLIFSDAFGLNVHLFQMAFLQILNFAFPMVLAGTCLTALVAFYIFPYNWSWNLSMTFGAILSATDPVAVSALLAEVGAPPRLQIHISGESLMNDGSALVFFQIFSGLFYYEIGLPQGEELTVGEGFAKFFRGSLGGTAIGIGFGIGLVCLLYFLDRRLNEEENVVQVAATVTFAYLTYYVADVIAATSGVIAVVFCGLTAKAYGSKMINSQEMMSSFWSLAEHLLNTVLFALGGAVWGEVISNPDYRAGSFKAKDWGYLFALYCLLQVIRYFLLFSNFPITKHLGVSTNWKETFFAAFAGLRGAIGISLAIALDNTVNEGTTDVEYLAFTNTLFGMVGGIAFLTLVVNGTLSGPVLIKLGLADDSKARVKIIDSYRKKCDEFLLDQFIHLLTIPLYRKVDFATVQYHIPSFRNLTADEFKAAVKKHESKIGPDHYKEPYVNNVLSYLEKDNPEGGESKSLQEEDDEPWTWVKEVYCSRGGNARSQVEKKEGGEMAAEVEEGAMAEDVDPAAKPSEELSGSATKDSVIVSASGADTSEEGAAVLATPSAIELRSIFIEVLRASYNKMIESGELDTRRGFISDDLLESLDWAQDSVRKGKALDDFSQWEKLQQVWFERGDRVAQRSTNFLTRGKVGNGNLKRDFVQTRFDVMGALAFMGAHFHAQEKFANEFANGEYAAEEDAIIKESNDEVVMAVDLVRSHDIEEVEDIVSHILCIILMNKLAKYVEDFAAAGLLKSKEANHALEEIEKELEILHSCSKDKHHNVDEGKKE